MHVWSVHATKVNEVGAVEIIFETEGEARKYAQDRSKDYRVSSTAVTRFEVGRLGTRTPVTWYVKGEEQGVHWGRQVYPT